MRSPGRIATLAVFISAAFVLASLERLFPNPVPMIRLGLGNIMTLVAFVVLGVRGGAWVTVGRVALVSLVWGGIFSPTSVLSAAGGACSLVVMIPMMKMGGRFSLYGISLAGAYAHVLGQLTIASFVYVGSAGLFYLLPFLGVTAIATGLFNAGMAGVLVKRYAAVSSQ
jgi:heptaprenyl diphosphate synthase